MRIGSIAVYGSHLQLYDVPDLYLRPDNILGHQPMGIREQEGARINHVKRATRGLIAPLSPAGTDAPDQLPTGAAARAAHQPSPFRR